MLTFTNPKINLGLQVLGKRTDGYHDLLSIFYPILKWNDALEIVEAPHFKFENSGLLVPEDAEKNLVVKAYRLLQKKYDLPNIHICLHKTIPMGAGLGGGSSNATGMIHLLDQFFKLQLSRQEKLDYALQLGSDCAFFVENKPKEVSGRGEFLENIDLDLSAYAITIIYPSIAISTAEAFRGIVPQPQHPAISKIIQMPINTWKNHLYNDFETTIFPLHPVLKKIKEQLYEAGGLYASMTGTGSCIYGIFEKETYLDVPYLQKVLKL